MGQTKWRKWGRPWREFEKAGHATVGTFIEAGPKKPVKHASQPASKVFLIGDITAGSNTIGDEWPVFDKDDIVYRYVEALSEDDINRFRFSEGTDLRHRGKQKAKTRAVAKPYTKLKPKAGSHGKK